jgi:hypothetical protein
MVMGAGCATTYQNGASEQALLALIRRAAREAPADSALIAVCANEQRISAHLLERLQAHSTTPLVACDRRFDSRDGRYFDRSTKKRLWAVNLGSLTLGEQVGSAEGSVHCGITCGGSHRITLAQSNGEWSVVELLEISVF